MSDSKYPRCEVERLARRHGVPGVSACIQWAGADPESWAWGTALPPDGAPMTPTHRMLSASTGKTFTATRCLQLAEQGLLGLDSPLGDWLGEQRWFHRLANADGASVRQLLNHTAGIPDHRASARYAAALRAELCADPPNPDLYFSPVELVGFVLDDPADFAPGTDFCYTETGYILLGLIVERVTGNDFIDELLEHIIRPAGLTATVPANSRHLPELADGLIGDNPYGLPAHSAPGGVLAYNPATEWAGGGFLSTPTDLARWCHLLYSGQILRPESMTEMQTVPALATRPETHYGLGCYLWDTPLGPAWGHGGEAPGYRSVMMYFPDHGLAVAVQVVGTSADESLASA
jgi:D-alanyl-D-alanine carboxypeptidase